MNKIALLPAGKKYKKNIKDAASEALETRTSYEDRKAAKDLGSVKKSKTNVRGKEKHILLIEYKEHQNYIKYIEVLEKKSQHV